jgi:predicted transposase/invertase (TIGR01784 family)
MLHLKKKKLVWSFGMAKPWDEAMKKVVAASPQAFVDWLFPGGRFIELVTTELPKKTEEPLRSDNCLAMELDGQPCVAHLEFQSTQDPEMPERLLEYALRITRHDLQRRPVYSCVIYVRPVGEVQQPPLVWEYPNGRDILRYHYGSIELAELEPALFLETNQAGLLPLLPLTKGGASRKMAETMFSKIQAAERTELIPIGTLLASLAFGLENSAEQGWLTRKVSEMYDILQETPVYQFMTKEAREEGLQEGLEKGRQEGLEKEREGLRQVVVDIVRKRFPKIVRLTKKQVAVVDDPAQLRHLAVDISVAQTAAEVTQYLLAIDEEEGE